MNPFSLGPKARAAGYRLRGYETIGSTNSEAAAAAAVGDPGGIWFAALEQTAGRGRRGRQWVNPRGNLAATLLIVPDVEPSVSATLGFVAGVALRSALAQVMPDTFLKSGLDRADSLNGSARVALKWPNDVLADGAKLAGILLEASKLPDGRHSIAVGIGINIVSAPTGLPYPATCLADLGVDRSADQLFLALAEAWVDAFAMWNDGAGVSAVLEQWREAAAGIGSPVAVSQNGDVLCGIFETIDGAGRLIVRAEDNRRIAITAGDVHFGATASARS